MEEIDLLPEWYKHGRRKRVGYRKQCIALGVIFLIMVVWHMSAAHTVSSTAASIRSMESKLVEFGGMLSDFSEVRSEVAGLKAKQGVLKSVSSRIDVGSVLAELSFLIDENTVLSKVEFRAEEFPDKESSKSSGGVRLASKDKSNALPGGVRFRVLISGIAADSGNVAELICRLEDSPYFCQVYPSFSKNKKIKAGSGYQVSEFEIVCYLANYKLDTVIKSTDLGNEYVA